MRFSLPLMEPGIKTSVILQSTVKITYHNLKFPAFIVRLKCKSSIAERNFRKKMERKRSTGYHYFLKSYFFLYEVYLHLPGIADLMN